MLTEPIDISSSDDSDFRAIDNYTRDESPTKDSATSTNVRVLPSWAPRPSSDWIGTCDPSERATSPERSPVWSRRSSNFTTHSSSKPQRNGITYSATGRKDNSECFNKSDDDGHLSKRAKRTLPTSIQPPLPNIKSNNLVESIGGSQFRGSHGNSYYPVRPNSSNGESSGRDRFGKGGNDASVIYESRVRLFLQPYVHGKYASTSYANSESLYLRGVGEERSLGTEERLIFQAALQDINQPKSEYDLPEGLLSVSLLRHQKIALKWMMQKETDGVNCLGGILADDQGLGKTISMIAIIQAHKSLQEESKSENICSAKTEALNLDDDDDVDVEKGGGDAEIKPNGETEELEVISEGSRSLQFRNSRPAAGTLVVCPASVLRQWARELEEKVEEKLDVLIYHGGHRTRSADELAKYDVVLTTYAIVTNEVPKQPLVDEDNELLINAEKYGVAAAFSQNKKNMKAAIHKRGKKKKNGYDNDANCGTLARVRWFRVILDEAQTIKNHRTQVARACCSLRAKRRWCLSGTPIQNAIDELFSYFRFLKYEPYCKYNSFCEGIKTPISRDSVRGYAKLQLILRSIMLRRTKGTLIDGQPIITLPPKTIILTKVDFTAQERAFYNKLEADSRSQFKAYADAGTLNQNYANILLMLLRLRQACDHPQLVKGFGIDSSGRESTGVAKKLPKQKLGRLLKLLETSAICSACNDPPEDAVVTVCGHVFCFQCVSDYLTGEDNTCPAFVCKEQLNADVIFSKATLRRCLCDDFGNPSSPFSDEKPEVLKINYNSSKIRAALDILQTYCQSSHDAELNSAVRCTTDAASSSGNGCMDSQTSKPTKAIIFSQWTRMLDLVEVSLNNTSIKYRRLDGTMSLVARDKAVKEFNTNPEVTVMLMSLKAGNLGLNMVVACRVILLDLWWNPTTEDQAIDRAHRIGQTRPVTVSRLTIKDTVEDRILALQEEKRKMVASAFGEDQSGSSGTRLTMEDLRYLFGA